MIHQPFPARTRDMLLCIADRSPFLYACPEGMYLARKPPASIRGVTDLQRICDGLGAFHDGRDGMHVARVVDRPD